jgi:hypothetical protein
MWFSCSQWAHSRKTRARPFFGLRMWMGSDGSVMDDCDRRGVRLGGLRAGSCAEPAAGVKASAAAVSDSVAGGGGGTGADAAAAFAVDTEPGAGTPSWAESADLDRATEAAPAASFPRRRNDDGDSQMRRLRETAGGESCEARAAAGSTAAPGAASAELKCMRRIAVGDVGADRVSEGWGGAGATNGSCGWCGEANMSCGSRRCWNGEGWAVCW